ncbi:CidA/LrgA family protein [Vibrio gallicus]|uniref:CidA/LrgA family protein n=1 Tax=Vibrio gallicus TaxID=190897 RepID=UPI0021C35433|nr:CidA/LrgA family protein [Vibrio gallicus]
MINKAIYYLTSAALICLALFLGNFIQEYFSLSVPGSVIGLILLFLSLVSGIVQPHWVQPSASFLIKYMIILFIPTSVGLMNHFHLLINNALAIVVSVVGGTLFVLCTLSLALDKLLGDNKK